MFRFLFDSNNDEVQQLTDGSYQLFLPTQIEASKLVVSHVSLPYTMYNVNDNNNRILINGINMKLKMGNYSVKKLLTEFKNVLKQYCITQGKQALQDVHFLFDYDDETYKFNFKLLDYPDEFVITFLTSDGLFGAFDNKTQYVINSTDNPTQSVIMDFIADLNSIGAIMIRSNLQSNYLVNGHRTNVLLRMPVDKPLGSILTYNNTNTDVYIPIKNLNNLFIQLCDDSTGEEISLNGGHIRIEFICIE